MALLLAGLFGTGCAGYRLGPTNGLEAQTHSIQINPLVDKTREPRLADYVMNSLRRSLQQDGTYRLDTHNQGDVVVDAVLASYRRSEIGFSPADVITVLDYEIYATLQVTARDRATGRVLVSRTVTGRTAVEAGNDLPSAELRALPVLAEDTARLATEALVDGTW